MKVLSGAGLVACMMVFPVCSAQASPVYLSCEFAHSSGKPQVFNFALDRSAGTFGVFVPSSGSQRMEKGTFAANTASLNEGTVAWEIDLTSKVVIRNKRMVGEKDRGTCKTISGKQSGFDE